MWLMERLLTDKLTRVDTGGGLLRAGMPKLIHIGMQRSGSSFLYNHFRSHPGISVSNPQETNFYSVHFEKGTQWYLNCFCGKGVPVDTSPKYFLNGPIVAPRIAEDVGADNAKLLLILRNPIDYAHSHFQFHMRSGYFNKRRDKYPNRTDGCFSEFIDRYPFYLDRAKYWSILANSWLGWFPPESLKIVYFEHLICAPVHVLNSIYSWMGVEPVETKVENSLQNTALRGPFLYKVKRRLAKRESVKAFIRNSQLVSRIYQKLFTSSVEFNDVDGRRRIASELVGEVRQIETLTGREAPWTDFM